MLPIGKVGGENRGPWSAASNAGSRGRGALGAGICGSKLGILELFCENKGGVLKKRSYS